ncbi:hypothetical protein L5E75_03975 [Aliarcobacter butzleri]|uniref:hypothetical protein n=1 Tax=Aliarcobacter butzleri TaxID=28197 RepID=UPI001ED9D685|nr:hypothetical protein [Aliarcobacter butzleri]MCG3687577.1 hypothetical protein [Aliarcobacter butzleri]MCG3712664.1 hypothetical protein [Aliarcobacter butzleri]
MIKINYSLNEESDFEKEYFDIFMSTKFNDGNTIVEKFDKIKVQYPFNVIFYDISLIDIILLKPNNLKFFKNNIELRIIEQSPISYKKIYKKDKMTYEVKDKLSIIFDYDNKFQSKIANFFEKNIKTRTCYYCNIHLINEYKYGKKYKNEFTLDHYYNKALYPYLALSLYNLIPSCYICNSKLKKSKVLKNLPPSSENFDFHEKVKFKLFFETFNDKLSIKSIDDIDIILKEQYSSNYYDYIKNFNLDERYKSHKNIVLEMIRKYELYPESRLKELQNLTGIPFQQIKKDIFNLFDNNVDLADNSFSKLIIDMTKELKLD